jgi:hypothetical protein
MNALAGHSLRGNPPASAFRKFLRSLCFGQLPFQKVREVIGQLHYFEIPGVPMLVSGLKGIVVRLSVLPDTFWHDLLARQ